MNCKKLFLVEHIDQLIRLKTTRNTLNLTTKLDILKRHIYNIINKMKVIYKATIELDKKCS